ncbi:L-aminoadipate-semialdehyde dehydrogenase [Moesziomyces antarcticus]|uniref:Related to alpha-aminoadipate reductase n=1 Tax=Pseudozyma antarctica TaxID=84753 RepID=A0A5C3FJB5_PSEA2|nr:L-aminoadipate-semialdehyde dehydrogenase [Moesziomyces antarcticus]GAK63685.1 L-aminoadipate-semialdehyde dehydrogenase [Moesziomyces antarcticus]SPO44280.1 related to alpha-aminoadipate reductase [Moesziomyces antarcticus]
MTVPLITDSASLLAPFKGRESLNALIDTLIHLMGDGICISYIKSAEPFEWQHITAAQLDSCIRAATAYYAQYIPVRRKDDPCRHISLFTESSFDHLVTQMALMRLGYGVVLISPNNSVPAVAHLVKAMASQTLVFGPNKAAEADKVNAELKQAQHDSLKDLDLIGLFSVKQMIAAGRLPPATNQKDPFRSDVSYEQEAQQPSLTMHSSGSTGFPKPYSYSHETYMSIIADFMPYDALCTAPIYHGFGCAVSWRHLMHRRRLYIYSGTAQPDLIAQAARNSTADLIYAVPFVFKMLSEHEAGLEALRNARICCYSGAPCPIEVGDMLVAKGVNLIAFLGSTEFGQVMDSLRDFKTDKGWNVMRPSSRVAPYLKFENVGTNEEGPYELVVVKGWKGLSKVNRPDGSYASGDHYRMLRNDDGSIHGYVYLGRGDDTLVHVSGEKTNPVPMEQTVRSSPLVRDCLVFGAGQPCTGALIIPYDSTWAAYAHLSDQERQAALKKQIEPLLAEVNAQCPSHSRLVPEMVRFLPAEARFPVADKGSIKRAPANALFAKEILQLYNDFALGLSTPDNVKMSVESKEQLEPLIRSILEGFIGLSLKNKEDVDLTSLGVDSIMDGQIRSKIHRSVRMAKPLPGTIVFQHPTPRRLTDAVYAHACAAAGQDMPKEDQRKQQKRRTYELLSELRSKLKPRVVSQPVAQAEGEIVVLTGVTGSLGAHILDQLRSKPGVAKVICLNRAGGHEEAQQRTLESLNARGLAPLTQADRVQVVSLASDISRPLLGLSQEEYDAIASSVTCVIHNAWPVNFVMSIDSFQSVLEGTVQLMNLAGQSTGSRSPRFVFSSSISVALNSSAAVIDEDIRETLDDALDLGYAHSKWIVENLCRSAQEVIGGGFQSVVMRIGQMVGDRERGIWNESEAPPLMIKSAQTIGCLPDGVEDLYWLPVDVAGLVAAKLTSAALKDDCVLVHMVSDEPMPWKKALVTLAAPQNFGQSFEVVPYAEWVDRLAQSDQNPTRNPTIKLLEHYRSQQADLERGGMSQGRLATVKLRQLLSTVELPLSAYRPEYLTTTIAAWRRTNFLQ